MKNNFRKSLLSKSGDEDFLDAVRTENVRRQTLKLDHEQLQVFQLREELDRIRVLNKQERDLVQDLQNQLLQEKPDLAEIKSIIEELKDKIAEGGPKISKE